ncbi:MAG: hypothetical protein GX800_10365 [Clostridiaceae bacterium]|jgi:hypothetical protein|nr:hypothetical protein [Clostridiaceae bacterium]
MLYPFLCRNYYFFISEIASRPLVLTEFDVDLWTATIDSVTFTKDNKLIFEFKDSSKIGTFATSGKVKPPSIFLSIDGGLFV